MTNKNLIKFAILNNQPLELTLYEPKEESDNNQNYLAKNMILMKQRIMKKDNIDQFCPLKKTNRTTYLTKNLQKLKHEIKNRKETEREKQNSIRWHKGMQYINHKSSNKFDNQQLYSVRESSNPFRRKKNDAFDLQHIKKKIDTCNRNIEENRIKNNYKKIIEANNIKSKYADANEQDALVILTNESNRLLENINSNLTTYYNTKTAAVFSEEPREKNILKDSVEILKIIKRKNNKVKFKTEKPYSKNHIQANKTTELIKIRNEYDSSIEKNKTSVNKKLDPNENFSENFRRKLGLNLKTLQQYRNGENQLRSDTYRFNDDAEENLKTFRHKSEFKTEEEFTRDFAKDFKRVMNRLEKDKNRLMANGMFNTKVILDVFEGRRELEVEKMKKKYFLRKPLFVVEKTNMNAGDKLKKLENAFDGIDDIKNKRISLKFNL